MFSDELLAEFRRLVDSSPYLQQAGRIARRAELPIEEVLDRWGPWSMAFDVMWDRMLLEDRQARAQEKAQAEQRTAEVHFRAEQQRVKGVITQTLAGEAYEMLRHSGEFDQVVDTILNQAFNTAGVNDGNIQEFARRQAQPRVEQLNRFLDLAVRQRLASKKNQEKNLGPGSAGPAGAQPTSDPNSQRGIEEGKLWTDDGKKAARDQARRILLSNQ